MFTDADAHWLISTQVEITDTERGLNYVAAGLAYYNKNEVFSDPFTLAKCDRNFDYDAQSPQPQCWGPDSSAVDVGGYKDRGDCSGDMDAFVKCPVPLTVRGTQALVSFAPLAFKLFFAARQNAVLRRSHFPSL